MTERLEKSAGLTKIPTGLPGFDDMSEGGLPRARTTVVAGSAGSGKTLFAMQSLVNIVRNTGRAGLFVSFEEAKDNVVENFSSFDWKLADLLDSKLFIVDGRWDPEAQQSGGFDIGGLLAMAEAVSVDGKPGFLVLDGVDALFTLLPDPNNARRELLRLQKWVEKQKTTTLLTLKAPVRLGEDFPAGSPRGQLEDVMTYMADAVVVLEREPVEGIFVNNIAIQKYRGSNHTQSRIPYLITSRGFEIECAETRSGGFGVSSERLSTGVEALDTMLNGGFFRGSTTLVTGAPGTSKTTLACRFAEGACQRGEKGIYICFDEAPEEIIRNMTSVNIDLQSRIDEGQLLMEGFVARAASPDVMAYRTRRLLDERRPDFLVLDPVSAFAAASGEQLAYNAIRLIIHQCKRQGVTVFLTSLMETRAEQREVSRAHVSTLADNWINLSYLVASGERNRALSIVKSRGTAHSNQVRELILSEKGLDLETVYTEEGEVLMGALRWQKEERSRERQLELEEDAERRYRTTTEAMDEISLQISHLQNELEEKRQTLEKIGEERRSFGRREKERREKLADIRTQCSPAAGPTRRGRDEK